MSADPTTSELLELLRETREYSRYFGELGVETAEPAMTLERTSAVRETQAKPRLQSTAKPVEIVQPAAVTASDPTQQDSLFGDLAQPNPLCINSKPKRAWKTSGATSGTARVPPCAKAQPQSLILIATP